MATVNHNVYMSTKTFTPSKSPREKRAVSTQRGQTLDLREAMDGVTAKITLEDIAKAVGCGANTLRQSRMSPEAGGYRSPPAGLQRALHELCKDRAKYFTELAEQLRPLEE